METAYGLLLGIVITISVAGLALTYVGEYAQNISDEYQIISDVTIHRNQDISIIAVSWTNAGNFDVTLQNMTLLVDPEKSKTVDILTRPHQSNNADWIVSNVAENEVIKMKFLWADGFESMTQHRLR